MHIVERNVQIQTNKQGRIFKCVFHVFEKAKGTQPASLSFKPANTV